MPSSARRKSSGPRTSRAPAALRVGDQGAAVARLQRALKKAGFSPGAIDGDFGPATHAAVMAFQASEGLLVDKPMVLMALATIRAETESFEPVGEGRSRFNTSPAGRPFDLYDHRRDLGNQGPPDGERYRGRGYVQLTGRFNYRRYGEVIGLGDKLEKDPDLASRPDIAGRLLSAFLKSKERRIKEALVAGDLRTARRLVNGGSHGLDRFSDAYLRGERLLA